MNVLISGAGGLVGRALQPFLSMDGNEVRRLVRAPSGNSFWWNPETGEINSSALSHWPIDAFVHLAGENIASRRWSREQKTRIRQSRVEATQKLAASLLKLPHRPRTFVSASAVGYYGDRGDEILTEQSSCGSDFLSEVVREWEHAAEPLVQAGVRVMHFRFGMILSSNGGALQRMLPVFKAGLGGRLGNGRQWVSWIALPDVVRLIGWGVKNEGARGPYNAVAPNPVRNAEFTRTLAGVLKRPAFIPAPAILLRLAFGKMADALLLTSQRAVPERLLAEGFVFDYPMLRPALQASCRS